MSCRCLVLLVSDIGKAPWGVCSKGLPVRVVRRRATLPHPVGCSTIAVPGLSFRVRNGTGRLTGHGPPQIFSCTVRRWGLPACGGTGTGQRTRICRCFVLWPDNAHCRLVSFCKEEDAVQPPGVGDVDPFRTGRLHPSRGFHVRPIDHVFCMGTTGTRRFHGMLILEQASRLDAFSGYPSNVANRPCHWRDNRHTRGSSTQVLSYYGQASSAFQRAQRIETKLSHDVLNPARVPL